MLNDVMTSNMLYFLHFERIETARQLEELIDPAFGEKIVKIQKKISRLNVTNERDMGG